MLCATLQLCTPMFRAEVQAAGERSAARERENRTEAAALHALLTPVAHTPTTRGAQAHLAESHPRCDFCARRFYDDDGLWKHMQQVWVQAQAQGQQACAGPSQVPPS